MSSILKVDQLQDSGGNAIITSNGSGTITVNNQTFKNGITMVDRWRLTTDKLLTSTSSTDLTSNLERNDTTGFGRIGTGMTESSGIFTFPSTGIYLIESNLNFLLNDSSKWILNEIKKTLDNSSYTLHAYNYQFISQTNSSNTYAVSVVSALLDVTDTSLVKVKFSQARYNGNVNVRGDTTADTSFFTFTRLGDT
tara:strand:+ start:104 stop:688 length:585 start_codon:yes stop_codon:yes gene_type:complete